MGGGGGTFVVDGVMECSYEVKCVHVCIIAATRATASEMTGIYGYCDDDG